MGKIEKNLLPLAIGSLAIGGITLSLFPITFEENNTTNTTTIVEPEPIDEFATDKEILLKGQDAFKEGDYETAINYFVSISNDYPNIEEVQESLLNALVLYANDIKQNVDNLVSNPNADSTAYTEAINLIDKGLEYLASLDKQDISLNDKLSNQRSYVKVLINIYEQRKNGKPFEAFNLSKKNKSLYEDQSFFIDLNNIIIDECKEKINEQIDEYISNEKYTSAIDYINNLSDDFIQDYQDKKKDIENNYLNHVKDQVNELEDNEDYKNAKSCVDNAFPYLKKYEEFMELYNKWTNYSPHKLYYQTITDESNTEKESVSNIDHNIYDEVIVISKNDDENFIEFSLNDNYDTVSGTIFLTDDNYNQDEEIIPLSVSIQDDQGNIYNKYDGLTYKQDINFSSYISHTKYLRIVITGESRYVKVGIRDGILE